MAVLKKSEIIKAYNAAQVAQSSLINDSGEKAYASKHLKEIFESFSHSETYDIFLSHAYDDSRVVKQIRDTLVEKGHSVYVDWLEDDHLNRGKVSEHTAFVLKNRMNNCSSLIYLTSQSAERSVWMPWELGYMDARTNRVAVAPILDDDEDFDGREYLGIYPYLDLTENTFYIQQNSNTWVNLDNWMKGDEPKKFSSL